jgi:hypothetical protein
VWGYNPYAFVGWNVFDGWYILKINLIIVLFLELGATNPEPSFTTGSNVLKY